MVQFSFAQSPVASFVMNPSQGCVPLNITFNNTSQFASSYQWDFGNGNTSTLANPSNVYTSSGVYTITLTASGNNGATDVFSRQITISPRPQAAFSVQATTGCQGSQIFDFQNTSSLFDSCLWDFGDGTTSNATNPQHVYSIAGTFTVSLVVYNSSLNCSDMMVKSGYITVFPAPTAIITLNDSVSCDPSFNFQFSAATTNAISWNWLFGDGTFSGAINAMHAYGDTGYYQPAIYLTSGNGCSDTVFTDNPVHIKWNPVPAVTVSDDTGCMPHYLAMIATHHTNANYQWDLGNGVTRNIFAVYYTYPDSGIYPVQLAVTYANGCSQNVNVGPVVVHPRPFFNYFMSNYTGCAPLNVQFLNTTTQPYTWLWQFGDGDTSIQKAPSHTYTSPGTYQVSLTATNAQGCSYGYALNQRINVFSAKADFSPDATSGCPPLTVNFNNSSSGAVSYFWDFGDGTTSTQQHPSHIYATIGSYQVTLIATDVTGCADTLVFPTSISVTQYAVNYTVPPVVNACAPYALNFSDASGAASFLWDFGDGSTSTASNPYHVFNEPGTYTVSLTTTMPNGGCEQHIPNFQTFVIDGTDPGFTYTVSPCPPYTVFFNDTTSNAAAWQWTFGDGGSSTLQDPQHIYPGPGIYNISLAVTTPNGCTSVLQAAGGVVITGLGANATVVCTDTAAPFNAQFYANSSGATWWLWDFGDGSTSSLQNPNHVFTTPGPHSISLTVGNDSCQAVYTYPPLSFGSATGNGGGLGGPDPYIPPRIYHCAPYTVNFNNPDPYAIAYQWNFGDGTTSTLPSPEHMYTDSGAFLVSVYLYQASGVVDTIYYSDTIYVVKPFTDFGITTTNLCTGVVVDVSVDPSVQSVLWNFGGGATQSTASASFTYPNVNASYMISMNVTDSNGCESFLAKSFAVNAVSPLSVSSRRACAGDSLYFDPGNVNYSQYQWNFGDNQFSLDRTPAHAYQDSGLFQVQLLVTDINGCVQTFTMNYVVEVFDPIADFNFTPPLTNCTTVYIMTNNLSTGSNAWFWDFGDGTYSTQFNPYHTYSDTGYHDITLVASKNICRDTMVIPSAVYVSDLVPDFTYVTGGDCVPSITSFTDISQDAVSWLWDFGDGDTSTLQNPTHTYLVNPRDSITLTVKDINGCSRSVSKAAPRLTAAAFSLDDGGGCSPFLVTFSDSSSNAAACSWSFGDGNYSNSLTPQHAYTNDGFYNVGLTVTSPTGCTSTVIYDSLVHVNTPVAAFSADSLEGCAPWLVTFDDNSINAVAWDWKFDNGKTSGNQYPSLLFTSPGVYGVDLIVENMYGCTDSIRIDSMVIIRGPLPSFTISSLNGCAPHSAVFTNTASGAINYEWHFGDGNSSTTSNPVHVFDNPGTYTVSLFAFDSTGCSALYTYPVPVSVSSSPTTVLSIPQTSGCAPFTAQLDLTGTDADSLLWDFGDGTTSTGLFSSHTYSSPGNYVVKLIAYNLEGCTDTLLYPDTIHVFSQPQAAFSVNQSEGCMPLSVVFMDSSSGLENPVYSWDFGNGQTSSALLPSAIYTVQGLYTISLIVTNANGCSDTVVIPDMITVFDDLPPPAPFMNRVTVLDNHSILVDWSPVNIQDLDHYNVYRYNALSGVYDSVYSVSSLSIAPGTQVISFVDSSVFTRVSSYKYKVEAVDKCGYRLYLDSLVAHESIWLNAQANGAVVDLVWTGYGGCGISSYEIYRKDHIAGSYAWIASVNASVYQYTDATAWCPYEYSYRIVAKDICGNTAFDSQSNIDEATPVSPIANQQVDITRATVVDDQFVLVEWLPPVIMPDAVDRYDIYRSSDSIDYYLLGTVTSNQLAYSDYQAAVDHQQYYYKIMVRNACDTDTRVGLIGSSIHLQKEESGLQNILKWSRYSDWSTGVDFYVIEKMDEYGNWVELQRVPGSVTQWEEK